MIDTAILKSRLTESGRLSEEAITRAEDYALTTGMALDEAIIFLKMMNYSSMGKCLADIYEKPYLPLLGHAPPDIARSKVSQKTAESLFVFPLNYDAKSNTLTLAVCDPADPDLMKKLQKSVLSSVVMDITVASKSEINMAIDVYYKGRPYIPAPELHVPQGFTIVSADKKSRDALDLDEESKSGSRILLLEPDLERSRALITILRREGFPNVVWSASLKDAVKTVKEEPVDMIVANGRSFKPQGNWIREISRDAPTRFISCYNLRGMLLGQEYPYVQMSDALISLISFIVRESLKSNEEALADIVTTARFCKLLAMRMGLPAVQVDGAVLAAWLSAPGVGKLIYEHMSSPYPLSEIFETKGGAPHFTRIETLILVLVKKYQALKKNAPEIAGDIDKVRKELSSSGDLAEDKSLREAFLNVIKDEEFLKDVGRSGRRVLMVDPGYLADSALAMRLSNDGYEVAGVPDARAAAKIIFDSGADLVISEVNLPETDGLRFCRALRENPTSAPIPFFFLTVEQGDRLATQCLEAGADDFFTKPPDLEMMSIKIRNILVLKSSRGAKRGISGTLRDMSFTDIIQSLTTGDKDVEIRLANGGRKGVIYIQQGEVIHAQAQGMEGQDAFYRLMTWQDGAFEITACTAVPPRNIYESAMSLLMEGARIADEKNLPDEDQEA